MRETTDKDSAPFVFWCVALAGSILGLSLLVIGTMTFSRGRGYERCVVFGFLSLIVGLGALLVALSPKLPSDGAKRVIDRGWMTLVVVGIVGFLALLIGIDAYHHRTAMSTNSWPRTTGGIIKSSLRYFSGDDRTPDSWGPEVTYGYVVDGRSYTSSRVYYNEIAFETQAEGERLLSSLHSFPKDVEVYYSPDDPSIAVLIPGEPPNQSAAPFLRHLAGGLGAICLLAGVGCLIGLIVSAVRAMFRSAQRPDK